MLNILKFPKELSNNIFFFSDAHVCHAKLLESRRFATIKEHDNAIISNWNNTVNNDSVVFYLGDMVLGAGEKSYEVYLDLLNKLNYRTLYIMAGNHYAGLKKLWEISKLNNKPIDDFYRKEYNVNENKKVYFIPNYYEIIIGNQPLVLSHYPILSFNNQRAGAILCHGHSHHSLHKNEWIEQNYYKGKIIDVGYEGVKKPISFNQIEEIMKGREIVTFDHH